MKRTIALFALVFATASVSWGQEKINVYFDPSADSPQIGELEAISMAVPAQWPEGSEAIEGWYPVYYRGTWEVFVENNNIAKDLSAKPGSPYYLGPDKTSLILSIATEKDKVDIISVDTSFCKMQLETILVGYIPTSSEEPQSVVRSTPANSGKNAATLDSLPISEMRGIIAKTGLIVKSRTGLEYKLINRDGKSLALLETNELPNRIQIRELVGKAVSLSGRLKENENGSLVILHVQNLSLTN